MDQKEDRNNNRRADHVLGWLTTSANYTVLGASAPEEYKNAAIAAPNVAPENSNGRQNAPSLPARATNV